MTSFAETVRPYAEAHGRAVVAGDMGHVVSDIAPALHPELGAVAGALPNPVTGAEVEALEEADGAAVAVIRYDGESGSTRVRSTWTQVGERPLVTAVQVL